MSAQIFFRKYINMQTTMKEVRFNETEVSGNH